MSINETLELSKIAEVIDFVWNNIPPALLEEELNNRFENQGSETRVRITYVNN